MRVLKFGGTSVGCADSLRNVKQIVCGGKDDRIVVVSALGGVTDLLLKTAAMAQIGDGSYLDSYNLIVLRHKELIEELGLRDAVGAPVSEALADLKALYQGVNALKILPEKTRCEIVAFGEKMSSMIVAALIPGARLYYSTDFIKTSPHVTGTILNGGLTDSLVKDAFRDFSGIAVVPGFISTDTESGDVTNLGRGGSDYTASIIAASLDAEALEIWTDVDGFMTADPRIIKNSYVIDELSFAEAMELCNFGAKVVYAPALYPVCPKDIPVHIKNTFNPSAKGTVIRQNLDRPARTVSGLASIGDISLITLSAPSMAGLIGTAGRLFKSLSDKGINVITIIQSSSETGITVGVSSADAELARDTVDAEFSKEIRNGSMHPVSMEKDLSAIAVVGEGLKYSRNIAGKLFSTLGCNGIGVIACAQGSSEYNISIIVEKRLMRKTLNVIHDSFFLSTYKELNLFICGIGTVGGDLLDQIRLQRQKLMDENNLKLNIVGIARSTKGIFSRDGIDLNTYKEQLQNEGKPMDLQTLRDEVIGMSIFNSVFVDCTASADIASLYRDFFDHGISVVAANKVAASSDYENYAELKALARKREVKFLFETNVGAGLPIINTINALRNSGDKIQKIEAVLSGTLNFIFNTISADIPFSKTVKMAQEQGFSEPDPRVDLSGKDVIRKLVILSREAGYKVNQSDVEANLFIPADFFDCTMEEFWERLPSLDAGFEKQRRRLEQEGKCWRFVACMENGRYSVSLREIPVGHSFYVLEGSNNIILLTTERYHKHPMLIQGYGAGASVTAAGVFADIMSIANI